MRKIFVIISLFIKTKTKIKLGDIKFVINRDTLERITDIKMSDTKIWTDEQLILREKILNGNYTDDGTITITKDNICVDGNHRLTSMKEVMDQNTELNVYRLKYLKWGSIYKAFKDHKFKS
jgi:hypothetical protein